MIADDRIERVLRPGEKLLWAGAPDVAQRVTSQDAFLIPFSLLWGGFAIFWEVSALTGSGGPFFALWGIPFVAVGLYMIGGRFIYRNSRRRRTSYAVTSERAIVAVGDASVDDSPVANVATAVRRSRDGHVTVTFGSIPFGAQRFYIDTGMEIFNRGGSGVVAFSGVAADDGERMLRALDEARRVPR